MEEIWKDVQGYEGEYQISNLGNVFSVKSNKELKITDSHGYGSVMFCHDGKTKRCLVHRLVAEAFIPNPNDLPQVNHIDENKRNNRIDNLEWCTASYNMRYSGNAQKSARVTSKAVNQLDMDGNYIRTFESISAACRYLDKPNGSSGISKACKQNHRYAFGYKWEYVQ